MIDMVEYVQFNCNVLACALVWHRKKARVQSKSYRNPSQCFSGLDWWENQCASMGKAVTEPTSNFSTHFTYTFTQASQQENPLYTFPFFKIRPNQLPSSLPTFHPTLLLGLYTLGIPAQLKHCLVVKRKGKFSVLPTALGYLELFHFTLLNIAVRYLFYSLLVFCPTG